MEKASSGKCGAKETAVVEDSRRELFTYNKWQTAVWVSFTFEVFFFWIWGPCVAAVKGE